MGKLMLSHTAAQFGDYIFRYSRIHIEEIHFAADTNYSENLHSSRRVVTLLVMIKLAALYRFVSIDNPSIVQQWLKQLTSVHKIQGTLIVASEGLNGTVAGTPRDIDQCIENIRVDPRFTDLGVKYAFTSEIPFVRMNVKLKKEIVTLGTTDVMVDPNERVGEYLMAEDWDKVIHDPDVTVIDCRNDYEYELGTFERAINPCTKTFREFPEFVEKNLNPEKQKKIAMFCTGGIRCEKASSYMLAKGFETVYHLKGGILQYLEDKAKDPNSQYSWNGECFVFDDRVSVGKGLVPGEYVLCRACRHPLAPQDRTAADFIDGVQCSFCAPLLTEEQKQANLERQKQMQRAKELGIHHLGREAGLVGTPRQLASTDPIVH